MSTNLQAAFDLTEAQNLFKIDFKEYGDNVFNTATPTLSQIEKTNDFVAKRMEFPVPFGYQGGVGSGSLPEANVADYQNVVISSKKVYARALLDREAIAASMTSKGAFVQAMKESIEKTVEAFTWNMSRILFGDGTGLLGTCTAVSGTNPYTLTFGTSTSTFKEANFEERMFVNIETGNTDLFEITTVTPSSFQIVVQRQAGGTQVPVATDGVYLQGSENNDPEGLKGVCDATSSTKYSVNIGRRWQAYQVAAGGAGITPDLQNNAMLQVEKKVGKAPNLIVTSYNQYEKVLNQLEDQKRYTLTSMAPRSKELKGVISYEGVQFMSSAGPVKIFPDRFCEDDRMYFLNTDYIKIYRRPKSGWFTDDGTTYLRVLDEDQYEARYGMYGQIYIAPTYQAVITGLAT